RRAARSVGEEPVARRPSRHRQADGSIGEPRPRDERPGASLPKPRRTGRRQTEGAGGRSQPANVLGDGEGHTLVGPPRVVDPVAVEEPAVERGDASLTAGDEAPVQPDEHRSSPGRISSPSARRRPAVLSQASARSRSGSESATIPPPPPYRTVPRPTTAV